MIKICKIIFINLIFVFIIIFFAEIIFGNWLSNNNYGNLLIPRYSMHIINDPPYDFDKKSVYSRDKNGFRANIYNLENVNILIIGGSTTEEREVDDDFIWTKIFEREISKNFNLKVLNAGIGGQTSFGHKKMFDLWFSRHQELKPNFVIVYLGINDSLYLIDKLNLNKKNFLEGRSLNNSNRDSLYRIEKLDNLIEYAKNNSAIHLLYLIWRGNYISWKYGINYGEKNNNLKKIPRSNKINYLNSSVKDKKNRITYMDMNEYLKLYEKKNNSNRHETQKFIDEYLGLYEKNLLEIIDYSNRYEAKTIFVTQKVASYYWISPFVEIINRQTIKTCKAKKLLCFKLHEKIIFDENIDFYDGVHTTPSGSQKIGKLIADFFVNNKL